MRLTGSLECGGACSRSARQVQKPWRSLARDNQAEVRLTNGRRSHSFAARDDKRWPTPQISTRVLRGGARRAFFLVLEACNITWQNEQRVELEYGDSCLRCREITRLPPTHVQSNMLVADESCIPSRALR